MLPRRVLTVEHFLVAHAIFYAVAVAVVAVVVAAAALRYRAEVAEYRERLRRKPRVLRSDLLLPSHDIPDRSFPFLSVSDLPQVAAEV